MNHADLVAAIEKVQTGISGFDFIADGGLPRGRTALVAGTAGSGKTIFATQFLAEGIRRHDEAGVFITFEEQPGDIRRNMRSFGWPIGRWEDEGCWLFVDASPEPSHGMTIVGDYDFGALLARIEHAVSAIGAGRSCSIPSVPCSASSRIPAASATSCFASHPRCAICG